MYRKTLTTLGLVCCFIAWGVSPVQAAPLPIMDGSIDSGWTVDFDGATTGVSIVGVDLSQTIGTATITVTKDFGPYEVDPFFGQIIFPVGSLIFNEVDPNVNLLDRIIIQSEQIVNNTGAAWHTFRWELIPLPSTPAAAEFNIGLSSAWDVSPEFGSLSKTALQVIATKGAGTGVLDGATFSPSGDLVVDIALDSSANPISITLKQHALPEPATMSLLLVGGIAVLSRRFRKR